jgi:transposase-like protein
MGQEDTGCPTCKSADTMSTDVTLVRDTRHCFGCRRSFDIELSGPTEKRLRREDRSNALPSERRR